MPIATFPEQFDIVLTAVLQRKIGEATRRKIKDIAAVDKVRLAVIAERFLKLYRENLRKASVINNLSIPSDFSPGPLKGYPNKTVATNQPLLGAIGVPRSSQGNQFGLIEKIRLGPYATLQIRTLADDTVRGILSFYFRDFSEDPLANYYDGTRTISWARLVEHGFDVPGYVYVPKRGIGRSGYGVMRESSRFNFKFAATHVFEDVFRLSARQLTPAERALLILDFVG